MSAHEKANPQVRPCNSFSYFYERHLVSGDPGGDHAKNIYGVGQI
jgi:hypothetical protein